MKMRKIARDVASIIEIKDALSKLNGEEHMIQNSQKELESTEVLLKQK
jgi:hypothetical protein